ncbi:MAG: hypothetical protein ACFB8W_24130 [Elainellaceae cyanobacterium]
MSGILDKPLLCPDAIAPIHQAIAPMPASGSPGLLYVVGGDRFTGICWRSPKRVQQIFVTARL